MDSGIVWFFNFLYVKEVPEELVSYMLHLTATNLLFLLKCEKNIK
ncbi:DUF7014 domain-containing protein [Escherichia coli]